MKPDALALMKRQSLHELSKRVVTIPSSWSTVHVYNALVDDGMARLLKCDNPMMRSFEITDEGRKFYAANPNPPLFQ